MKNQLIIRLRKSGRIRRPFYNIVVTFAHKSPKSGYIARLGYYDPFSYKKAKDFNYLIIFKDVLNYWISKGAKFDLKIQKLFLCYVTK